MPLFGRRLLDRKENDSNKNSEENGNFIIEHTGEKFNDEKFYEKLKKIYDLERWTCECTWRSALTHKQAFDSEIETRKSLETIVPRYFHKIIFEIIHQSVKTLEKLAEEISIVLGQSFVIDEPVQFKKRKDSTVVKGTIEKIEENEEQKKRTSERASAQIRTNSDKQLKNVKYTIRLSDEDRLIPNVQPNELQRSNLIPNREKLKSFIRSYAIRLGNRSDSPWIFYDSSIKENFQLKDRLSSESIEKARRAMTITVEEIFREQEKLERKLDDDSEKNIFVSSFDSPEKEKSPQKNLKSRKTSPEKNVSSNEKSPQKKSKSKKNSPEKIGGSSKKLRKQLTLDEMKFTSSKEKSSSNENIFLEKSTKKTVPTYNVAVPSSLLQKLEKGRRERGVESKFFQRLVLHCARTLNEKQRNRLPDEFRSLIENKFDELELKRRLSEMTEQEKKNFFQNKQKQKQNERKTLEDLDLSSSKNLPPLKSFESSMKIPGSSIADLLVVSTFFTSFQSLFLTSLNENLSKSNTNFLRTFKHENFFRSNSNKFFQNFIEILQIILKILFKEEQNRSNNDENSIDDEEKFIENQIDFSTNENFEQIYDLKLFQIPITTFTSIELTRIYLIKEKENFDRNLLEKIYRHEINELTSVEQIDLIVFLVNLITTNNELMSEHFEFLTRTMTESFREKNQLLAERRKLQEQQNKQKKLQLQNGENGKISPKKQNRNQNIFKPNNSSTTTNDENQTSIVSIDDPNEFDVSNDEDLKTVIQRRRQTLAISKELKEQREIQAQNLLQQQKLDLAIEKAEQNYQEAVVNLQFGFRIKPLGYDRHYNRYWFFKGYPGIFVEKGWIGSEINYSTQTSPSSPSSTAEKSIPKDETNSWWTYDSEQSIEQLKQSLNHRGVREQNLLENLKKISPLLQNEFEQMKSNVELKNSNEEHSNEQIETNVNQQIYDIVTALKTDLEEIENRLRHGSLGGFIVNENLIEWQNKLKESNSRSELADLLIQLQQTVPEKFASGMFGNYETKAKTNNKKKSKISTQQLPIWINDCRNCQTFSRLHVLMMIFENSIAWNKSTVGLKCKVCRRKHKDEFIAVCDQCCQGYHLECLRAYSMEQTKNSLNELWYCPACRPQPVSKRRTARNGNNKQKNDYYDDDIYEVDVETTSNLSSHERSTNENGHDELSDVPIQSDDENVSNEETICSVCAGENRDENELIQCIQCRNYFHCQCHEPPLRCLPRSTTWMCTNCRNGVNTLTTNNTRRAQSRQKNSKTTQNQRQNGTRRTVRKNYRETDDDTDYEEEEKQQRRSKRLRRSSAAEIDYREEKSDDEPIFSRSTRRRVKIASSSSSSTEDDDDDEQNQLNFDDDEQNRQSQNEDFNSSESE